MVHQKSRVTTLRLRPTDDDALDAVAAALRLDRSSAIRFLVFEKARALGLPLPTSLEPVDTRQPKRKDTP
jgi:hypothetical protein